MDNLPRAVLKEMVGRYGNLLAQDPVRCEGLLRDSCSKCNREIFVLVNAARQRIPDDLLSPRHALPLPLMKGFLAKRLQDELGFSDEASRWAVESWAEALGIGDSGQPSMGSRTPAPSHTDSSSFFVIEDSPVETAQHERWIDNLKNGSLASRLDAVTGLSHTPGPGSLRTLVEALDNSEMTVREKAFNAVSSKEEAVQVIMGLLPDARDGIAWRLALILGGLRVGSSVPDLIDLLEREGRVRLCAIWALGEIGDKNSVTRLMKFLNNPDPVVKKEAVEALKKIGQV